MAPTSSGVRKAQFGNAARGFVLLAVLLLGAGSLLAVQASLNLYFQSTLTDAGYQKAFFAKLAGSYRMPKSGAPKPGAKVVVQAVVAKDGKLVSAMVSTESGSPKWDAAALAAVKAAAPYPPLPSSYGFAAVQVHVHVSVVP